MSKLYVINKTSATLVFKNGYLNIPRGSFGRIMPDERNATEFVSAEDRGWISISDKEPSSVSLAPKPSIEIIERDQGMTAEELKAEKAKEKAASSVTIEAIGQTDGKVADGKVEAIGQDTTVEVNPAESVKSEEAKPARKAKKAAE